MTAMTSATSVAFRLDRSGKERMRRSSIELGIRVLRSARMDDSADFLSTLRPEAVVRRPDAMREFATQVIDWEVIARSSRRSGLRYVAWVMNKHRERDRHRAAIALLHQTADDIPVEFDGGEDLESVLRDCR